MPVCDVKWIVRKTQHSTSLPPLSDYLPSIVWDFNSASVDELHTFNSRQKSVTWTVAGSKMSTLK